MDVGAIDQHYLKKQRPLITFQRKNIQNTHISKKVTQNFKQLLISLYDTAFHALSHSVINFALNVNYNENH